VRTASWRASEEQPSTLSEKCPHWKKISPNRGRLLWTAPCNYSRFVLDSTCVAFSSWSSY